MKYIEDYVIHFADGTIRVGSYDERISQSLGLQCWENKAFTQKQAEIALRLIKKYRSQFIQKGYTDIEKHLINPVYKLPLRVISQEKMVSIKWKEKQFVLKFPFNQELVTELRGINNKNSISKSAWDAEEKHWTLDLNEPSLGFVINKLIPLGFSFDEELREYIDAYEKINKDIEQYIPMLVKENGVYKYKNIKLDFETTDLLTALVECSKNSVNVFADDVSQEIEELLKVTPLARMFVENEKQKFFVSNTKYSRKDVINLTKKFNLTVAIFLDDTASTDTLLSWTNDLVESDVSLSTVGVYFRQKNEGNGVEFNKVIRSSNLNKESDDDNVSWVIVSSKYPKSLIKVNKTPDICICENRYVSTHHSVISAMKNSIFTIQYNEHVLAGEDIAKL
jgi:hypothetical protein